MYLAHFGLTERPFSLAPDPRFFYLSARHREALAHLLYGLREGGGFVQLTGEVGTGKTTVCRYLLERLPSDVDVALILNPRLTAAELLATVCDELRVPYPADSASLKVLVDVLYSHLLEVHGRGRRVVLIIDEAQNLSPEVLEQVRLLTNLETVREKLLQIILIGQPELVELLGREKLRQLAQRITARYHLAPFDRGDTHAYVHHRLKVAGRSRPIFDGGALREVHRRSRGIPRLINIICDRALLGAYASDQTRITAAVVRRAAREVFGKPERASGRRGWRWLAAACGGLAAAVAVSLLVSDGLRGEAARALYWGQQRLAMAVAVTAPTPEASARPPETALPGLADGPAPASTPDGTPPLLSAPAGPDEPRQRPDLPTVLADPSLARDRSSAFASLYARWRVPYPAQGTSLGCEAGRSAGLSCVFKRGTWNVLRRFGLPAIVELLTPTGDKHYAAVAAVGEETATLEFGSRRFTFPLAEIGRFWDGSFILVWRPPALTRLSIAPGARGEDVAWLKRRLGELDGGPGASGPRAVYDDALRERVVAFQRSQSLVPDGTVGEQTIARLIAAGDPSIPSLATGPP